jgi:hypothetical protein
VADALVLKFNTLVKERVRQAEQDLVIKIKLAAMALLSAFCDKTGFEGVTVYYPYAQDGVVISIRALVAFNVQTSNKEAGTVTAITNEIMMGKSSIVGFFAAPKAARKLWLPEFDCETDTFSRDLQSWCVPSLSDLPQDLLGTIIAAQLPVEGGMVLLKDMSKMAHPGEPAIVQGVMSRRAATLRDEQFMQAAGPALLASLTGLINQMVNRDQSMRTASGALYVPSGFLQNTWATLSPESQPTAYLEQ